MFTISMARSASRAFLVGRSVLYRWPKGEFRPTFHDVEVAEDQMKSWIAAFLNFPNTVKIPRRRSEGEGEGVYSMMPRAL